MLLKYSKSSCISNMSGVFSDTDTLGPGWPEVAGTERCTTSQWTEKRRGYQKRLGTPDINNNHSRLAYK